MNEGRRMNDNTYKSDNAFPLRTLFWETTLRCNARCEFCGSSCGDRNSFPEELTTEEICTALSETASTLDPKETMLNITGGEPLVRSDVLDVAEYASGLGFPWGMVTNGSLITPEIIARMKSAGMKTITVSIDGCRDTHEGLRKLYGSYDRIMKSLRQICSEGFCDNVQVTTVVNKRNINELEELRKVLLDIGLDSWRIVTADPIGRARDNEEILPDRSCMERYLEFLEKYSQDPVLPVMASCSHYFGDKDHLIRTSCFECGAGKRVASILYNGDIFVCPNVERRPELIQGNVRTHSLPEVWQKGFGFFRNRTRTLAQKCKGCYYKDRCLGDSLHTYDFDKGEPLFCIRDYYSDRQSDTYDKMPGLYSSALSELSKTTPNKSILRISYDIPSESRVIFTGNAGHELRLLFHWGHTTDTNRVEQMAALYGSRAGSLFVVRHVRETPLEFADEKTGVFTQSTLDSAVEGIREIRQTNPDILMLGFVHSHPGELKMSLSQADADLHLELMEKAGLSLSMLINPQKKQLKAYFGKDFDLSEIYLDESFA